MLNVHKLHILQHCYLRVCSRGSSNTAYGKRLFLSLGENYLKAHRGLNTGQHDLQSYALPLSYGPILGMIFRRSYVCSLFPSYTIQSLSRELVEQ